MADIKAAFAKAPGIVFATGNDYDYLWYPQKVEGRREVFVGRVRIPVGKTRSHVVQFWNIADNLLKGAATNAVQILEVLTKG